MAEPQRTIPTSEPENVVFKGYKSGLALIIPESGPFEKHFGALKAQLEQAQDFFRGAKIALRIGNRVFQEEEWTNLTRLIQESGLVLQPQTEETRATAAKQPDQREPDYEKDPFVPTITVRKTIRSGQRVEFSGNLVIEGDVNPGAEVIASGDIIVLGRLRGTAHAGSEGDSTCRIMAYQLQPVQIRIAGVINRAPDKADTPSSVPEEARIKDGVIVVEQIRF